MTVNIQIIHIHPEPGKIEIGTTIYTIEISDGKGVWCETFNTEREVNAFLRGLRCRSMMPDGLLQPHPESVIQLLP